jgi:hypothetical protein
MKRLEKKAGMNRDYKNKSIKTDFLIKRQSHEHLYSNQKDYQ